MAKCISLDRNEAKLRTKRQSDGGIRRRATWIVVQDIQNSNTACWRRFSELNASLLPSRHHSESLSRSSVSEEPAARNQVSRKLGKNLLRPRPILPLSLANLAAIYKGTKLTVNEIEIALQLRRQKISRQSRSGAMMAPMSGRARAWYMRRDWPGACVLRA